MGGNPVFGGTPAALPAGATTSVLTGSMFNGGGSHCEANIGVTYYDAANTQLSSAAVTVKSPLGAGTAPQTDTITVPVPAGATSFSLRYGELTGSGCTDTVTGQFDIYCGTTPGTSQPACCPPDPIITALLTQILAAVTVIQRQDAPFGYIKTTAHAGLTGNGSIAVQGLLGAEVLVTTLPPWLGQIAGTPVEHFDVGFVTFGTADGFEHSERIDHIPKLVFPESAGVYTSIGYTLAPGVVATITEIVREP
jgi:hypothetical protein